MKFTLPEEKLQALGIAGVFLFGSQAQGVAGELSDFDFGVLLEDVSILKNSKRKQKQYDALYDIFSSAVQVLKNIDIVFLQDVNLQLCFHVIKDGKLLFLGNQKIVSDFYERTMEDYADFAPHRWIFENADRQRSIKEGKF